MVLESSPAPAPALSYRQPVTANASVAAKTAIIVENFMLFTPLVFEIV
jgi:hypothetical protein